MRRSIYIALLLALTACQYEYQGTMLRFAPARNTEAETLSDACSKLAVMAFTPAGERAMSRVWTQERGTESFGQMPLDMAAGSYTFVAVGHSSPKTPTIKSPQLVQFSTDNNRKNSDTFCWCDTLTISDGQRSIAIELERLTAMFRLVVTGDVPDNVTQWVFDYTGGSANVNPVTKQGCTKSKQSEIRSADEPLEVYTFPFMSDSCGISIRIVAKDALMNDLKERTFSDVPMVRNRITEFRGDFFGDGLMQPVGITFSADGNWSGTTVVEF